MCSAISGRLGAAGDANGIVRVVDLNTGETIQTLKGREKGNVTHMAFSKDGSVLSYHVDGVVHVVNLIRKKFDSSDVKAECAGPLRSLRRQAINDSDSE